MTTTGDALALPGAESAPQTAPAPAPPIPETVERGDTSYVILALGEMQAPNGEPGDMIDVWNVEEEGIEARSAETAIRKMAASVAKMPEEGLTLVAIPARSWRPVRIKPKVETTLVIEDA